MNGFIEPLPGLLDDPQFQIPNLPSLPDVHIAPLRNPAPLRHGKAPLPLEPVTKSSEDHRHGTRKSVQVEDEPEATSPPRLRPSDVLSAREAKKPHLAISELLETSTDVDSQHLQLPSFVSLAVVERSPVQEPSLLSPHKRLRLDLEVDVPTRDVGRRLPRPAQKDDIQPRPVPLLPAMVTGLHEPPPSAGILPSMDIDARLNVSSTAKASKMQVKDILAEAKRSTHVPPEAMLNTPDLPTVELSRPTLDELQHSGALVLSQAEDTLVSVPKRDSKTRRARRKWTEEETADLLAGVKKHGFGKWKQILIDTAFVFHERTSIDLKDRYRVYVKDQPEGNTIIVATQSNPPSELLLQDAITRHTGDTDISKADGDEPEIDRPKRKRRPWTPAEDAALIRGVTKHGFQWTTIHDDPELELNHRRATDLRDRIRNLYPEGYKQAEARPLRSETKRVDTTVHDSGTPNTMHGPVITSAMDRTPATTTQDTDNDRTKNKRRSLKTHVPGSDMYQAAEQVGVTLPSLALDDEDERDWGDNTLPPLLEWEEIGM